MFLSSFWARLLCNLLGYVFPAYMTFVAVTKEKQDRQLHAQWLTFWIVNSYFTLGEILADPLLSFLPLYFEIKIAFLVWLVLPRFRGGEKIYRQVIHPYLVKHESEIDEGLQNLQSKGVEQFGALKDAGFSKAMETVSSGQDNGLFKLGQQALVQGMMVAAVSSQPPSNRARGNSMATVVEID
ncbi:hypothetical protein BASA81_000086 [Batrachochytrium salamandrivorans]|nr:hypothetical protein BASA81_000086 [Batrachochytrium salamandrivorans]